jgi:uncharacterized protein
MGLQGGSRVKICSVWPLLLLPAAVSAASFDCSRASTSIEKLICNDKELSRQDETLAQAYRAALSSENAEAARASQRRWLEQERNSCDNSDTNPGHIALCLRSRYDERIFVLAAMATPKERVLGLYTRTDPACFVSSAPEGHECSGETTSSISVTAHDDGLHVAMELYFFNGHQCNLEGTADWKDGKLLVKGPPEAMQCRLELYSDGRHITSRVSDEMSDACQQYCGARGTLNRASLEKSP